MCGKNTGVNFEDCVAYKDKRDVITDKKGKCISFSIEKPIDYILSEEE